MTMPSGDFFQQRVEIELVTKQNLFGRRTIMEIGGNAGICVNFKEFIYTGLDLGAVVTCETAEVCMKQTRLGEGRTRDAGRGYL